MRADRDWEEIIYQIVLIWSWPTICLIILIGRYLGY